MAIPFGIAPFKNGQVLGFDVQVNDDGTGDGKRTAISNWNDLTGMGYTSTAGYGVLTLTGGSSETTTSATTIGTSTTTTTTATTATTTDTLEDINYGDVNLDGVVDLADSITLNKYLGQVLTLSDMALKKRRCQHGSEFDRTGYNDFDAVYLAGSGILRIAACRR